jgi:hypothetical protein
MLTRSFPTRRPSPSIVISFIALVLAMGGFAAASIPGRGGAISACYQDKGGSLRVIDGARKGSSGKCGRKETALSWPGSPSRGTFADCPEGTVTGPPNGFPAHDCTVNVVTPTAAKLLISASGSIQAVSGCEGREVHNESLLVDRSTRNSVTQNSVSTFGDSFALTGGADVRAGSHVVTLRSTEVYRGGGCSGRAKATMASSLEIVVVQNS